MAKKVSVDGNGASEVPVRTVRDPETGEELPLPKGYGALKGQFVVRKGIDLTKPIAEQVARLERARRRRGLARAKAASSKA